MGPVWRRLAKEIWAEDPDDRRFDDSFELLGRRMIDETLQNEECLLEPMRSRVLAGADCDEVPGGTGGFGRSVSNPVPVNGPVGEISYLSALRTPTGAAFTFHRLGSIDFVDVYEAVSLDGEAWELYFLDLYHPRRSRRAPEGLSFAAGLNGGLIFYGVNWRVPGFPRGMAEAVRATTRRFLLIELCHASLVHALERNRFDPPPAHTARLAAVRGVLHTFAATGPGPAQPA